MWDRGGKVLTGFGWYEFESTIQTNISRDYLDGEKSWDDWAALRECIQNALDEAQYASETRGGDLFDYLSIAHTTYKTSKWIVIRDDGRGCDFEHILLLGKSGKRDQGYRGEKGEGQLMAFLTFSKLNIHVEMFSQNWLVRPRFDKYNGGDNEVLVLDVYRQKVRGKNALPNGTVLRIRATDNLLYIIKNIDDYFPGVTKRSVRREESAKRKRWAAEDAAITKREHTAESERKRKSTTSTRRVFLPRKGTNSRLYLRGIYVHDLTAETGVPALFSYNLQTSVTINRDRSMVNQYELLDRVRQLLVTNEVTAKMREMYWQFADIKNSMELTSMLEYRTLPNVADVDTKIGKVWLRSFQKVYGKQSCLSANSYASSDAAAAGWNLVKLNPKAAMFAEDLGVLTDKQAAGFGHGDWVEVKPTSREKEILGLVLKICDALDIKTAEIVVVSKVLNQPGVAGFTSCGKVYILRSVFDKGGMAVLRVILHELGHINTGGEDFTRAFTDWFLLRWLQTLQAINGPSHDKMADVGRLVDSLWRNYGLGV